MSTGTLVKNRLVNRLGTWITRPADCRERKWSLRAARGHERVMISARLPGGSAAIKPIGANSRVRVPDPLEQALTSAPLLAPRRVLWCDVRLVETPRWRAPTPSRRTARRWKRPLDGLQLAAPGRARHRRGSQPLPSDVRPSITRTRPDYRLLRAGRGTGSRLHGHRARGSHRPRVASRLRGGECERLPDATILIVRAMAATAVDPILRHGQLVVFTGYRIDHTVGHQPGRSRRVT